MRFLLHFNIIFYYILWFWFIWALKIFTVPYSWHHFFEFLLFDSSFCFYLTFCSSIFIFLFLSFLFSFFRSFFYLIAFDFPFSDTWTLSPMIQRIPFSLSLPSLLSLFFVYLSLEPFFRVFLLSLYLPQPSFDARAVLTPWDFHGRHHPWNATVIARKGGERGSDTRNNFPSSFSCST